MLFASLILLPFYLMDASPKNKTDKIWLFIAGSSLALHFAFWISSLTYTSVAVSVLLVNTSPVLVALFSHFVFKEQLTLKGLLGVTLAFSGSILLFTNDLYTTTNWRGATLSLSGAVMFGIYLVAGKKIRHQANLIQYVYPTYALSTVVLGIFVLTSNLPVSGFSKNTYLFLFLLGLIPQCIGHTCYNWCPKTYPSNCCCYISYGRTSTSKPTCLLDLWRNRWKNYFSRWNSNRHWNSYRFSSNNSV